MELLSNTKYHLKMLDISEIKNKRKSTENYNWKKRISSRTMGEGIMEKGIYFTSAYKSTNNAITNNQSKGSVWKE